MLADIERLFERIFERSTARLFRAHLQAVQLERRVERSMERARSTQGGRTVVPARYRVRLQPDDLADVAAKSGGPEALAGRLADASLAFARSHGYHLPGRPSVALVADPAVQRGVVEVDAVVPAPRPAAPSSPLPPGGSIASSPVPDMPVIAPRTPSAAGPAPVPGPVPGGGPAPVPGPAPASRPVADIPVIAPAPAPGAASVVPTPAPATPPAIALEPAVAPCPGGIRGDGTETLVFRRPAPAPTRAVLRVTARDGSERTIEVDGTPLTVGRASDNGLVLGDSRVSRHHARLQARRGTLVFTDLGSTNGSRLNGVRVDECALGIGDRVLVGDTVLVVEQLPG
jgi:hypothetical protein